MFSHLLGSLNKVCLNVNNVQMKDTNRIQQTSVEPLDPTLPEAYLHTYRLFINTFLSPPLNLSSANLSWNFVLADRGFSVHMTYPHGIFQQLIGDHCEEMEELQQ